MIEQHDEEEYFHYELEAYKAEEMAQFGDQAPKTVNTFDYDKLPPLDVIEKSVRNRGFDSFEIREKHEVVKRYYIVD